MAHCEEYVELISANLDGALSPSEQEKLTAHLSVCPECQKLFDDLSALRAAMTALPPAEVPAELKGRIMDAVAAEKVIPFVPKKSPIRWQRWLASAAVLALVVLGTWSWKPWEDNSPAADLSQTAAGASNLDTAAGFAPKAAPAAPAAVPENATADAPAEASLTTEATGPLDYCEPMTKAAPAAGDALPSEAPAVCGYSWTWGNSGDAGTGSVASAPAEDAPLDLESIVMPQLYSITTTSAAQSVQEAPQAAPIPAPAEEGVLEQSVTSQAEAVSVLANYIYEFVGDVELVEDDLAASYAVNSPTGVSGVITCAGEDDFVYFLDYKDDLSPDVLHYSVSKQTGEVTLLEQVPAPAAEDTAP